MLGHAPTAARVVVLVSAFAGATGCKDQVVPPTNGGPPDDATPVADGDDAADIARAQPRSAEPELSQETDPTRELHFRTVRMRTDAIETWPVTFPLGKGKQLFPPLRLESEPPAAWPMREAFLPLRTKTTTIFATDGLSDPFQDPSRRLEGLSGFGLELWIETDQPIEDPARSWMAALVIALSYQVADGLFGRAEIDAHGMFSLELDADEIPIEGGWPARFVSPDGGLGVLIGVGPKRRSIPIELPSGTVRYCGVRLLDAAQLSSVRSRGPEAAEEILADGWLSRVD